MRNHVYKVNYSYRLHRGDEAQRAAISIVDREPDHARLLAQALQTHELIDSVTLTVEDQRELPL